MSKRIWSSSLQNGVTSVKYFPLTPSSAPRIPIKPIGLTRSQSLSLWEAVEGEGVRYPRRGKAPQGASCGLVGAWLREGVRVARRGPKWGDITGCNKTGGERVIPDITKRLKSDRKQRKREKSVTLGRDTKKCKNRAGEKIGMGGI